MTGFKGVEQLTPYFYIIKHKNIFIKSEVIKA